MMMEYDDLAEHTEQQLVFTKKTFKQMMIWFKENTNSYCLPTKTFLPFSEPSTKISLF